MLTNMLQLTVRIELFITEDTYSKCKKSNRNYIPYDHKCLLISFADKFRNVTFDEWYINDISIIIYDIIHALLGN